MNKIETRGPKPCNAQYIDTCLNSKEVEPWLDCSTSNRRSFIWNCTIKVERASQLIVVRGGEGADRNRWIS